MQPLRVHVISQHPSKMATLGSHPEVGVFAASGAHGDDPGRPDRVRASGDSAWLDASSFPTMEQAHRKVRFEETVEVVSLQNSAQFFL